MSLSQKKASRVRNVSVAVVIPLYNHERYIGAAIESVLKQTRPVSRIVVLDDGSIDGSAEVVRKITDQRVSLFTQPNAGAHAALNWLIREARDCEFIAILNSDDMHHAKRIEKCLRFLKGNPLLDVVCTNFDLIDSSGVAREAFASLTRGFRRMCAARHELVKWLGRFNFFVSTSNIFARSRYLLSKPFRAYRYLHDYFFVLLAAFDHKLGILDEPLLSYRRHGSNTILQAAEKDLRRELLQMNLDLMLELAPQLQQFPNVRRDFTRYAREMLGCYPDFRAKLFLQSHALGLPPLPVLRRG